MSTKRTSYSATLTAEQSDKLERILRAGNYRPVGVPHTSIAVEGEDCRINLYKSGKLLIQGRGTSDFVLFVLEPEILGAASMGYEDVLDPAADEEHMGIDESGKGDFFGPLVVAAAYVNPTLAKTMRKLGVKDGKKLSDKQIFAIGSELRKLLGANRYKLVQFKPATYNKLYAKIGNVNRLLAWAHARAIENMLESIPGCPRAVADQFGAAHLIERSLMKEGRKIVLEQHHKAESDLAVAAASILAREAFLYSLQQIGREHGVELPKGASEAVREAGVRLVRARGPAALVEAAKCHFRTTDAVLVATGHSREELGELGQAVSRAARTKESPQAAPEPTAAELPLLERK